MSDRTIGIYKIGPEIGKGSFATVYKCVDSNTHQSVAIKSVVRSKLKSKKLIENLEVEISILKSMKHPHIVGLLDYHQTNSHFHLIMDYCSMGDLSYFIRRRDQLIRTHPVISSLLHRYPSPEGSHGLNETLVIHFLQQLSSALHFLRSMSLVHRDIKPQNLLLCPPAHSKTEFENGNFVGLWELPILKIADFGFARFLPSTSMAETLCGSPLYMAPEILRYEKYNAKADLWSVGAVFYEMTVGKPPFRAANHIELLKNIEKSHDRIKFPSSAQVPEHLKSLIRSLLKYNPTERMSFNEFFDDPLITKELHSIDKPLDTSDMDENLFISEYISPINPADRDNLVKPPSHTSNRRSTSPDSRPPIQQQVLHAIDTQPTRKLGNLRGTNEPQKSPIDVPQNPTSRDEQIKLIIHKNSPDPTALTHSIQAKQSELSAIQRHSKDDVIFEKDYVVVEKRAVEVNAIADELARVGTSRIPRAPTSQERPQGRELSLQRRPSQKATSSGDSQPRRASMGDRRISISISPTNALGRAINLASNRLFGNNAALSKQEEGLTIADANNTYSTVISNPNFANDLLLKKSNLPISNTLAAAANEEGQMEKLSTDERILRQLESIATKSHAINLFADVKFSQLIPSPPSSNGEDDVTTENDFLPPKIVRSISEEGVVLYVKTLSLLAKGMAIASTWWNTHYDKNIMTGENELVKSMNIQVSTQINELVQWLRLKFNECLERAEFIKLRLGEANANILKDEGSAMQNNWSSTGSHTPGSDTFHVVAEKLIFDRALEISRNAAVNELVKEDLKGCELAYSTAIWMLEALLDEESSDDDKLDNEDKAMVEKFIVSIGNRLSILKKKLELL